MQSGAKDVDGYLAEVPEDRREVLTALRDSCRELLPGFEESMQYGMPTYLRDGVSEVAWASQKQYISLYMVRKDVLEQYRDQLAGLSVGKGCIRYRRAAQMDLNLVRSMLTTTATTRGEIC